MPKLSVNLGSTSCSSCSDDAASAVQFVRCHIINENNRRSQENPSGMEEFYSYKEKLYKKEKAGKQNTTQQKKEENIYITMYNYKLYTIARLVPYKSIQAVQLIY